MAIVYQYDKRHNVTYVYDSTSYYDKNKKQSRSTRKLIGRLDPETKQIVPTKKRSKASEPNSPIDISGKDTDETVQNLSSEITILRAQLKQIESQLSSSRQEKDHEHQRLVSLVNHIQKILSDYV